jgi:hypothetical protein
MGSPRARFTLLFLAVALAATGAGGAHAAGLGVLWLKSENRTASSRKLSSVDRIVVHVTEGSFWGSVTWLRNRRSHGSSHYVISRRGEVVQLVSTSDVAWHAGNRRVNRRSIGIEHEGWTRVGGFTDAQYRASAKVVAYLARRAGIPVDRRHIIGHDEVPHPRGRGWGGVSHHTDPGRHWSWRRYLRLIRHYTKHPEPPRYVQRLPSLPPAPPLPGLAAPRPSVVVPGARLQGVARWWSGVDAAKRWRRGIYRVDFFIDGRRLWTDRVWPFAFRGGPGWDTRTVANGRHMLSLRVHGRRGYRARRSIPVRVVNPPMRLRVSGVADHDPLRGDLVVRARPSERVERVALYVDGRPVSRDARPPYELRWRTELASEGPHVLTVYGRAANGRRAARTIPVVVANSPAVPHTLWAPAVDHLEQMRIDAISATSGAR